MKGFHGCYWRFDLPERFLREALSSGPARGARLPRARLAKMVRGYNLARGWNEDGSLPTSLVEEIFAELGLSDEGIVGPGADEGVHG